MCVCVCVCVCACVCVCVCVEMHTINLDCLGVKLFITKKSPNIINKAIENAISLTLAEILCPQNIGKRILSAENQVADLFCGKTYDSNIFCPGSHMNYVVKILNETEIQEKGKIKAKISFRKSLSIKQ